MEPSLEESALALRSAVAAAQRGLIEREALVEMIALAAVAGEHLLVIGPPGTAKSEAARRTARAFGGVYFEYLLGRFTEPGEVFGPVDLRKLREGTVEIATRAMLPEAEIAFLDEVFLGSTAILNTLLGILNERTFRRGHTHLKCPLRLCIAASNALPEEPSLSAFADRFLVRMFLDPVPDAMLEEMLAGAWSTPETPSGPAASIASLDVLARAARAVDLTPLRPALAHALRTLRRAGITLSDRRAVRAQRLVAAAATLAGRTVATERDLWPLITAVPTRAEQSLARDALRDQLAQSDNPALATAAEDASAGPRARARRLGDTAVTLLAAMPADPIARAAWKLRIEGVLRELDAGFARDALPPELVSTRAALVSVMQGA